MIGGLSRRGLVAAALCLGGLTVLLLLALRFLLFGPDDDGEKGGGPLLLPLLTFMCVAGASLASTYLMLEEVVIRLLDTFVRALVDCVYISCLDRHTALTACFYQSFDRSDNTIHYTGPCFPRRAGVPRPPRQQAAGAAGASAAKIPFTTITTITHPACLPPGLPPLRRPAGGVGPDGRALGAEQRHRYEQ